MSAKWVRSQQWDDRFFPTWAWPAKFLLRAMSSIWLSVLLLCGVAIFGTLASVPLGMLAAIPTWTVYVGSLLLMIALLSALPTWGLSRTLRRLPAGSRFVFCFAGFLFSAAIASGLWYSLVWPALRYDEVAGTGFRLFGETCDKYKRTMLRHLPGVEMSELEFYAWWPIKVLLLTFVANLSIATMRRIEFKFMNLGVLTVHSGIITIAIGSVYYAALKQEGDLFLTAGRPDDSGKPTVGAAASGFFYNPELTDPALWVRTRDSKDEPTSWEQRPIVSLPRYNDYGLDAAGPTIGAGPRREADGGRTLSIPVPAPDYGRARTSALDPDISLRVVGLASYGETRDTWVNAAGMGGSTVVRHIELVGPSGPVGDFWLTPEVASDRAVLLEQFLSVEYLEDPAPAYWAALQTQLPEGARHGLIVEVPAAPGGNPTRQVLAIEPGKTYEVAGWSLLVKEIHPEPPIQIITPGYRGATSGVAIVRVEPPKAAGSDAKPVAFDRYVYARFPELNQDLLDEQTASGMPKRRAADAAIKLTYVDASKVSVVVAADKPAKAGTGTAAASPMRAITRLPGRNATLVERLGEREPLPLGPMISVRVGTRYAEAEQIEAPWPVPEERRDRDMLRTRRASQIAVEVSVPGKPGTSNPNPWSTVLWLSNSPWHPVTTDDSLHKTVTLPDGRTVDLAFGRRYQPFPGFQVALVDFEMTPYPHTMTPKDYRSDLRVSRVVVGDPVGGGSGVVTTDRSTSMNNPLLYRVPWQPDSSRNFVLNAASWLVSWVAPTQYKLSQNSWDREGWETSTAMAARGEMPRAYARFTIIGVGNNPGIYIIAAGSVMMALGIPWAFYVKPWLLRREKARLAALVASGQIKPTGSKAGLQTSTNAGGSVAAANGTNGKHVVVVNPDAAHPAKTHSTTQAPH